MPYTRKWLNDNRGQDGTPGQFRTTPPRRLMKEYTIKVGDLINGAEVVEIQKDPFIENQIDIWVDEEEIDDFGNKGLKCIRVRCYEK